MPSLATAEHERRAFQLAASLALSGSVSLMVVASSWASDTRLGAPLYWAWVLTGLQVLAMWAAGRGRWWGWLLGAGVQPIWIVYAMLTGQLGFIPGCMVSAAVQLHNFLNGQKPAATRPMVSSDHRAVPAHTHSSRCRPGALRLSVISRYGSRLSPTICPTTEGET